MPNVPRIYETQKLASYLKKRGLLSQYKKAKRYLLDGRQLTVRFKEKNPKGSGIWYFRINKQFRALATFDEDGDLRVYGIDNHQN